METFDLMTEGGHEQLVFWNDAEFGYRGVIAIHDSTLGPALGGTRFWNYESDREAVIDALRLARGMSYKASVSGLKLGGGKSVIWGDNKTADREMIFRAHGRAVDSLNGRYITAEDVGTSPDDMDFVAMETDHVVGLHGRSGDPSPVTAYGVYRGIKASAAVRYGDDSLDGKHVAVQGLGHVGYHLCEDLANEGARLTVTDINPESVQRVVDDFGATAVDPEAIYDVDADVYAPCALGAVVNDETIERFSFDIIAGAANNVLARGATHGPALKERNILYAPDYVINAGGLINVYGEIHEWTAERAKAKAGEIYDTLIRIFELAASEDTDTNAAAKGVAIQRIDRVRHLQRTW
jgi:leucine dehydrogenase